MKITHEDDLWVIESTSGKTFLTERKAWALVEEAFRETIWEEVKMRWDEDPHWIDIVAAKNEIIEELAYSIKNYMDEGTIFSAIKRFVNFDNE